MKKLLLCLLSIGVCAVSCDKDEDITLEKIVAKPASNISYNSFQANWTPVSNVDFYELELSTSNGFSEILKNYKSEDQTCCSYVFDKLDPSVVYYYRIKYSYKEKVSEYSSPISVTINRGRKDFSVTTSDNIIIKATQYNQIKYDEKAPVVIFIHSGGANRKNWTSNELFSETVDEGYISIAYDIRGHGESGGTIDWDKFENDPNCLPNDFNAILEYIKTLEYADPNRIGIIGGSLGAGVGVGASNYSNIKTVVSLTCPYNHVKNLYGTSNLNTVFYVAGELDTRFVADAEKLYNVTKSPRKLELVKGTKLHGVHLINNSPSLKEEVFKWVKKYI